MVFHVIDRGNCRMPAFEKQHDYMAFLKQSVQGDHPADSRVQLDQRLLVRPANWADGVNQSISAAEMDRLHISVNRGRPYGSDRWTQASAARLGLQSSLRNPGRPRKITNKDGTRA